MKVFIKQNSIVTEWSYSSNLRATLLSEGFLEITVPDMDEEKPYTFDDFQFVNGVWKLK